MMPYAADEITAVVCVRLHDGNPWVRERLEWLAGYYDPAPRLLVVDFGSAREHADGLREACGRAGIRLVRMEDDGVFSLAMARNRGALEAETELLYFTDIDFFARRDLFGRLAEYATFHRFRAVRDVFLCLPAFHLAEGATEELWKLPRDRWTAWLERMAARCVESAPGRVAEFVAPYSNNFLCTRDLFFMAGGYDPRFRGHGSEDFEFMVRVALHNGHVELPADPASDLYRPGGEAFYGHRPYRGFRRLGEAMAYRAEAAGLRTFHLWHPVAKEDPWRKNKDKGRGRLKAIFAEYLEKPERLAGVDHLEHRERAVCVTETPAQFGYFLPFRALGYRVRWMDAAAAERALGNGEARHLMIAGRPPEAERLAAVAVEKGAAVIAAEGDRAGVRYFYESGNRTREEAGRGKVGWTAEAAEDFRKLPVTRLEWGGGVRRFERIAAECRIDGATYVNGRLGLGMDTGCHFHPQGRGRFGRWRKAVRKWLRGQ